MTTAVSGSTTRRTTVEPAVPSSADARFLGLVEEIVHLYDGVLPPAERGRLEREVKLKGSGSETGWQWG